LALASLDYEIEVGDIISPVCSFAWLT